MPWSLSDPSTDHEPDQIVTISSGAPDGRPSQSFKLGEVIKSNPDTGIKSSQQILSKTCLICEESYALTAASGRGDPMSVYNRMDGGAFHTQCLLEADHKCDTEFAKDCTHVGPLICHWGSCQLPSSEQLPVDGLACVVKYNGVAHESCGTIDGGNSKVFPLTEHSSDGRRYPYFSKKSLGAFGPVLPPDSRSLRSDAPDTDTQKRNFYDALQAHDTPKLSKHPMTGQAISSCSTAAEST